MLTSSVLNILEKVVPIANCFTNIDLPSGFTNGKKDIASLWALESGIPNIVEHMTVNFVKNQIQHGRGYGVMVWLYLPTLWSDSEVDILQTSLSKVLSRELQYKLGEVQILTTKVDSGLVVDNGITVSW